MFLFFDFYLNWWLFAQRLGHQPAIKKPLITLVKAVFDKSKIEPLCFCRSYENAVKALSKELILIPDNPYENKSLSPTLAITS